MDSKRLFLAIGLTLLVLWLYQSWLEFRYPDYYQRGTPVSEQAGEEPARRGTAESLGETEAPEGAEVASGAEVPQVVEKARPEEPLAPSRETGRETGSEVGLTVETEVLRVGFTPRGGDPVEAALLRYRQEARNGSGPVRVLQPDSGRVVVAQAGWLSGQGPAPTHQAVFQGPQTGRMRLDGNRKDVAVTFRKTIEGVSFRKTYRFRRDSYQVQVDYTVANQGPRPWEGHLYGQFRQRGQEKGSFFLYDYDGPVVFTKGSMQTFAPEDLAERPGGQYRVSDPEGWAGIMNRYFMAAWVPASSPGSTIYARSAGPDVFSGFTVPFPRVAPGEQKTLSQTLFLGPKEQSLLEKVGRNLRRSVDYGILSFLAIPLFEVMQFFHRLVGNYGFAIILVTLVIKALFFPLFSMSYRAMARMRKVQPELQRIRENYGDDRQKMNEEMMRLYREEKVNPLGGCLPILVQIPVFISLYWVLLESVELRHEPFMLWITDLTSKDPFYVLPVLMGASMVVQQLLNPSPLDPVQKKVMLALPVVFTVFFMQFPAGLVLYWLSNNLISIAQQWWITRKFA